MAACLPGDSWRATARPRSPPPLPFIPCLATRERDVRNSEKRTFGGNFQLAACALALWGMHSTAAWAAGPQFETDVLPILTAHCLKCHGREARKASLDLRTMSLLARGGESGPVARARLVGRQPALPADHRRIDAARKASLP